MAGQKSPKRARRMGVRIWIFVGQIFSQGSSRGIFWGFAPQALTPQKAPRKEPYRQPWWYRVWHSQPKIPSLIRTKISLKNLYYISRALSLSLCFSAKKNLFCLIWSHWQKGQGIWHFLRGRGGCVTAQYLAVKLPQRRTANLRSTDNMQFPQKKKIVQARTTRTRVTATTYFSATHAILAGTATVSSHLWGGFD